MSERQYAMPHDLPVAITPLEGTELAMFEQGGQLVQAPYNALTGDVAEHAEKHQIDGDDPIGTLDNVAYGIPFLDGDGLIDTRVSDASTTKKGKVQLATSGEVSATKAVTGTDARLSDARAPTAHAEQHIAGTDPIDTATVTVPGLMSAEDKVKADATIPEYIPTEDQKEALAGSYGTPSDTNRYVTEDDIGVGVCPLESGLVPSSNLPSYVDDVLEYANKAAFPAIGETGKIYVALDVNLTFRWSGSEYVEISKSLALGETSATAYRGDRGKTAYDHSQSAHAPADADNTQTAINSASEKTTPVDGDAFPVLDSAASNALKKTTLANVKAVLKGYFDGFYSGGGSGGESSDYLAISKTGSPLPLSELYAYPIGCRLSDTIFIVMGQDGEIDAIEWDGSSLTLLDQYDYIPSYSYGGAITRIDDTHFGVTHRYLNNNKLRVFEWTGTEIVIDNNYTQFAYQNGTIGITVTGNRTLVQIEAGNTLRAYVEGVIPYYFDFTGNPLAITGTFLRNSMAALNNTDFCLMATYDSKYYLQTYRFDGTDFTKLGEDHEVQVQGCITPLSATDIVIGSETADSITVMRFSSSEWTQVFSAPMDFANSPMIIGLTPDRLVSIWAGGEAYLQMNSFLFGFDSTSVNVTADYEVPELAVKKRITIWKTSAYDGNPVTITPPFGATFDGLASIDLYGQYSYVELERISATVFAIKDLNAWGGVNNTAIGYRSLLNNTIGIYNTAIGSAALYSNTTGTRNTAVGQQSLYSNTTGSYNTAVGNDAGFSNTTGSNNTFLGRGASGSTPTTSNQITLGNSGITSLRCAVTTITALSDRRDKKNIEKLEIGLNFVRALNPCGWNYDLRENYPDGKADGSKMKKERNYGFIAQDLQELQKKFKIDLGLVMDDNPDKLETSEGRLLPVLVKAVQELSEKLEKLADRLEKLEGGNE